MDKPIPAATVKLFEQFDLYAGEDGIVQGPEVDKLMAANFKELIENPKDEETCKELVKKVEAGKEKGFTKQQYAALLCFFFDAFSQGKIGLGNKPRS